MYLDMEVVCLVKGAMKGVWECKVNYLYLKHSLDGVFSPVSCVFLPDAVNRFPGFWCTCRLNQSALWGKYWHIKLLSFTQNEFDK